MGISSPDARRSSGGRPNASSMPRPSVAAETPSGTTAIRATRRGRPGVSTVSAARPPTSAASSAVTVASTSEVAMAAAGGARRVVPASIELSDVHHVSDQPSEPRSEVMTRASTGTRTISMPMPAVARTAARPMAEGGSGRRDTGRLRRAGARLAAAAPSSSTNVTTTSWTSAVAAAPGKSSRTEVWRSTCDSRVRVEASPSSSTMPSDVNEKTKTTAALAAMAERRLGRVTSMKARVRVAPSVRATSS